MFEELRPSRQTTRPLLAIVTALAVLSPGAAGADNPQARAVEAASPGVEAAAIHQAVTAARLAAWGRKAADAQALILAARMLAEIPFRSADFAAEPGAAAAPGTPSDAPAFTVAGLLDEAETLARGDGQTLAEIEAVRAAAARGVANSPFGQGPILARRDVQARQTYWFEADAKGGEILRVAAIGDGDTDIDMVVRGADGRVLCEDGAYDHFPVCTLTPGEDQRLRVEIINRGAVWTRVRILSN
ncbi:MAG: hypothetical protein ACI8U3_000977 [Brevundimonas sp.]